MLYEDKTVEVAVFIQIFLSAIEMQCNIVPLIRVGKHSFQFQAQYNRSGLALMDALKQDIKEFCSIFNTIKTKARKNSIKVEIDNAKLNKTVEKLFGVDEEADSSLEEHCFEDTPEIVCEEPDETEEQIHQPDEFEKELQRISSDKAIPEKKEGCYIATAVYGSYNAPEVITQRRFRDETLKNSFLGRLFIKVYYRLSSPVAERLKNAHSINKAVGKILDKWVNRLNENNKASQG